MNPSPENQFDTQPMPATVTLSPATYEVFRRGVPLIMEHIGKTWEQTIEHMALAGFIAFQNQFADHLQNEFDLHAAIDDETVHSATAKLKSEIDKSVA